MREQRVLPVSDLPCQSSSDSLRPPPHPYLLTESLNELEDHDLDALVADLGSKSTKQTSGDTDNQTVASAMTQESEQPAAALPPPSNTAESSGVLQMVT